MYSDSKNNSKREKYILKCGPIIDSHNFIVTHDIELATLILFGADNSIKRDVTNIQKTHSGYRR